jgi:hypothetical protein
MRRVDPRPRELQKVHSNLMTAIDQDRRRLSG